MAEKNLHYHYAVYKAVSKKKKLLFNLTKEEFYFLCLKNCFYCGAKPRIMRPKPNYYCIANGLDRIDSGLGYFVGNVVTCCSTCNSMKSSLSMHEFISKVVNTFKHLTSKQDDFNIEE